MSRIVLSVKKRSTLQWVAEFYCLILLFLPISVTQATSIYTRTTPIQIWYKYATFHFSALLVPAVIWALAIRRKSHAIRFDLAIVCIIIKDIIMLTAFEGNQVVEYNFSFNLILISAWSIVCIIFSFVDNYDVSAAEDFFDNYFVLAVISQFMRLILRMSTDGRYGAIGLSVGGTGYFAGIFIVYCLYYREYTSKIRNLMVLALISLILSGQRTNLLFMLVFCLPYIFKKFTERNITRSEGRKLVLLWAGVGLGVLLIVCIIFLDEIGVEIQGFRFVTRTIEAIEQLVNGNISTEFSVEGRLLSLDAGIKIVKDNPFGITNNFYDLQYRTLQYSFPTFPHNALLCCYLLWSPLITVFCLFKLIKLFLSARRIKTGIMWPILYVLLYNIITGSVFLDYPYLVITLYVVSLTKCKINQYLSEGQLQDEVED